MLVRAIAVGTEHSNAIGVVELDCAPHGLVIVYLGVGAFSEGYAPGALTHGTKVLVPWPAVLEARVEGDRVLLAIDPSLTPHHRLCLTKFSSGALVHPQQAQRQRFILWSAALGTALVGVLIAVLTVPRIAPHTSASATLMLALLTAAVVLAAGLLAERQLVSRPADETSARDGFAAELGGFLPQLVRLPQAPERRAKPSALPDLAGLLPRTTAAVVITLAAGLLGVLLTGRALLFPSSAKQPVAQQDDARQLGPMLEPGAAVADPERTPAAAPASPAAATAEPAPAEPAATTGASVALGGHCTCARADSPLWRTPLPKLSVLVFDRKLLRGPNRTRLTVEVAAVNNGEGEVRDLAMRVAFVEQDPPPSKRRTAVSHRAVFFEGPLGPGQAIKWTVEARGEDVDIEAPALGDLGAGGDGAAPTNRIAELLRANHRPVRLHGAMMLAYLGDPRAKEAALELKEALRDDESAFLERVLRALADVRACEVRLSGTGPARQLEACVFNSGNEPREGLGMKLRVLSGPVSILEPTRDPPLVEREAKWSLPGSLGAQQGVRVRARVELGSTEGDAVIELVVDREDLLP